MRKKNEGNCFLNFVRANPERCITLTFVQDTQTYLIGMCDVESEEIVDAVFPVGNLEEACCLGDGVWDEDRLYRILGMLEKELVAKMEQEDISNGDGE